ncbi:MAG TPA: TonB-dependent receptor, partial [Flavisolibacter sp.]|nr:TonB-dependent receptor [Flavisolibacter sp.]
MIQSQWNKHYVANSFSLPVQGFQKCKFLTALLLTLGFIFISLTAAAQEKFTISGTITAQRNGEKLTGVTVRVGGSTVGTTSNDYGFYSLTLSKGSYQLEFTAVGQAPHAESITLHQNINRDIVLTEKGQDLEGVVVVAKKSARSLSSPQMGIERLSMSEIKNLPVLLGERDVLKAIQLLPGIKSAGEGGSGFYVRGGAADQNLILLDEATVYNASHLLGFFSTFNSDAIKDVTVYKGGMPAQYGGRLSSVLDVKMNEGNNKDLDVSGGIGLISSKINVEGPLQKDRSSFLISARRTYADVFLKLSSDSSLNKNKLYFYDLNT